MVRKLAGPLTTIYTSLFSSWLLLRYLYADDIWWLAKLNSYPVALFLPALFITVGVLRTRQWRLIGGSVLPFVAAAWFYLPLFWPSPTPIVADDGHQLTIMNYNILFKNKDFESLREDILTHEPDIVGLQEITPVHAAAFFIQLGTEYPYQVYREDYYQGNVGLLSRYPIETAEYIDIPPRQMAMKVTVRVEEQTVHILIAHLLTNWLSEWSQFPISQVMTEVYAWRWAEVETLLAQVEDVTEPVLLLCDCNFTQTAAAYSRINEVWHDSFREVGWGTGLTSHAYLPVQRIDYIWHSDHFASQRAWLGARSESDHRPVLAELYLLTPYAE